MKKVCFMRDIFSRLTTKSEFENYTFDEEHQGNYKFDYHYGICLGEENVYITIYAYMSKDHKDVIVGQICLKTYRKLDGIVAKTLQELDDVIIAKQWEMIEEEA